MKTRRTRHFRMALAVVMAAGLASGAAAQMLMLEEPGTEARIDGRQVDVTVRFQPEGDVYKVDATFLEPFSGDKLSDIALELADGQNATYSPPGGSQLTYRFARDGRVVIVTVHRPSRLRLVGG